MESYLVVSKAHCSSNTILGGYGILVQFFHSSKNNSKTVLVNKFILLLCHYYLSK